MSILSKIQKPFRQIWIGFSNLPTVRSAIISGRWLLLVDLALLVTAVLMIVITEQTVLFFHIIFVLLAFGAFYWKFRGFILRVLFWVSLTTTVVLLAVLSGRTQPDELIEIPLLITILLMVFLIASRRAKTQNQLEQQSSALKQAENNLNLTNQVLGKQVSEFTERTAELTIRNNELDNANFRIQHQTAQFEALAQVTQTITAIRDLQELLPQITSVISKKFNFYHVGIFLLDDIYQFAILSAANSEGGKRMLDRKHRLRVGEEGIVGHAAATGEPRVAMDVGVDAVFFNNPDLPDTHSEMALPLISRNIIVGVLDVQSMETAAFTSDDIQMLSLLADQVSLAIENARLFEETRKALAESELSSRRSIREAWNRLPEQQKLLGYRYTVAGATPLKQFVKLTELTSGRIKGNRTELRQTAVPIKLRGEVIGTLVVQSPSGKGWNDDQLDLIKAVAERVALSAENARLFEETTARAEREKLVSDISSKIRSHTDPQSMIQTAISELQSALGASRVEVHPQLAKGSEKKETKGK